ncbi:MAG TPA: bifunctional 5,10-methylenetetrahydrofolate dehydrogenase/5,10-methenyltetrahydrofolate cyclohydrolase [Candidatus Limnocylindria bacterium]|nr:bifunctional 5,10-methylenetetrahydrofolate dehydrogenase/5,10-methenyltetrahydrofolate cyclohydrolase [Candidatus Limnocylindria bacterium]
MIRSVEPPAHASSDAERDVAPATILRGAPLAQALREAVAADAEQFRREYGYSPTLAAVMVGHEQASSVYVQQILRTCQLVGVPSRVIELPADIAANELQANIEALNAEREVAGIIVQMPLPEHIPLATVTDTIRPVKDIDGIHPLNTGLMALGYEGFLPACAEAAVSMLRDSGYQLEGKRAVVIGRSNVVGKPVQLLLLREHCTVTVLHRRTRDLPTEVRRAEVLVTAAGAAQLVRGEMLQPGALVVDVGINVVPEGIVGDVDFESAREVAGAITPVPGGVGPLTNAVLLEHLLRAARWQQTGHPITAGHGRKRTAG